MKPPRLSMRFKEDVAIASGHSIADNSEEEANRKLISDRSLSSYEREVRTEANS